MMSVGYFYSAALVWFYSALDTLGWEPTGPGLIEDLTNMKYF
jgi:hypothetical protein